MRTLALAILTLLGLSTLHSLSAVELTSLGTATRLVLVTTETLEGPDARMQLFERGPRGAWRAVSEPEPVVVGASGLAWWPNYAAFGGAGEPVKTETDGRSPAGIFPLGLSFGYDDDDDGDAQAYDVTLEAGQHYCVDDVASPLYNKIVPLDVVEDGVSGEQMWLAPDYRRGLLINYPTDLKKHPGSCIFVHIWQGKGIGTGGCVGMPVERVEALQKFVVPGETVIAILPEAALPRFQGLPQVVAGAKPRRPMPPPDPALGREAGVRYENAGL